MKRMIMLSGIMSVTCNALASPLPKADVYFRITDDLPKLQTHPALWYNGIVAVTNTGEIAFIVVTDKEWSGETIRFYREGTEEEQCLEDKLWRGKNQREREEGRKAAINDFYICIEKNKAMLTLQPGENVSFECQCVFKYQLGSPSKIYKAEMYLGHDTWVPVHITPTLGTLLPVPYNGKSDGTFYYSQEGTNQYLYAKEGEKFKRVAEMKLKSTPLKEDKEDIVTFQSPDGTKKTLTREQAAEIIREREQQNP